MNRHHSMAKRYIQMIRGRDIEKFTVSDYKTVKVHYKNRTSETLTIKNGSLVNTDNGRVIMTKAQYEYLKEKERMKKMYENGQA